MCERKLKKIINSEICKANTVYFVFFVYLEKNKWEFLVKFFYSF